MADGRASIVLALALAVAVALAYRPVIDAGFLDFDDNVVVSENPHIRTLSWETVRWAATTDLAGYAMPLTWLSHAVDYRLYGLDAHGHHRTSLLLHVANTVLVFVAFQALTGARWRSACVAALFGLHPLHVEAVAWIAERKEVLSAFFALLALVAYARFARTGSRASGAAVGAAFVAALLSKPMAMTLPAVLLLLDFWPLRRLSWAAVREKIPLFALALVIAVWAFVGSAGAGAVKSVELIGFSDRVTNAIVSYVRYLGLTVRPTQLCPWYSHPALDGVRLAAAEIAGSALALAALTGGAVFAARTRPWLLVGWLWYLGTLFPVIGLVQVGGQGMADRYTYVPLLGIFLALVWEVAAWPMWRAAAARAAGAAVAAAVLLALTVLTSRQAAVWHDPLTFWTTTLARNPRAAIAWYALAHIDADAGRTDRAIARYRRSLKLRPDYGNAHRMLGQLLAVRDRPAAAAAHLRKGMAAAGGSNPEDENNLGNVLLNWGYPELARRHLERAIAERPQFAEAHNNLGIVLANLDDFDGAEREFRAALAQGFAPARRNLAAAREARARPTAAAAAVATPGPTPAP
jgi:Tfp pilus assembly protein PilF